MRTIEYRTRASAKADWGAGPWQDEPDKKQWSDPATGMACLIVRSPLGALCGYVGVPEGHPLFEVDYGDAHERYAISVHGGLTFDGFCQEGAEEDGICHLVEPGEPDRVWWLGFDCGHFSDLVPSFEARLRSSWSWRARSDAASYEGVYRDLAYVTAEVTSLAAQLRDLA